ncbi:hypothetical protein EMCRGX_G006126 [Ephydatia muelleri]
MNDSKMDQVLEAICSLADSLLTPIIGDLATCVIQCEEAGRRSSSGMSPRAAMAAEDVKVEMHEVLGKAKQYVHSCKDVASYVCESGVLAEVEKDLSSGRIEELDSFLSDVGDYFTHCLSRLKQFVATEMRFRTKVGHQRSLPSSQSPLSVQDVPCGRESEVYCRVGVFVGTAVSLVVLMRQTGRESWASIGSLFFAAALSSLLRPQGVFGTCQLYCRMGTLVGHGMLPDVQSRGDPHRDGLPGFADKSGGFGKPLLRRVTVRRLVGCFSYRNAEAMYGSFETAKSLVDGWVKRTAQRGQSDDVDYEKIRASIRRLQSSMAKALKEVNVYLK